jgi:hypothetical protein
VEQDAACLPCTGDTEPGHRLQRPLQAQAVHQRHWPGVNVAVGYGGGYSAWHQLAQLDTAARHVKVKRFSMEIRETTDTHTCLSSTLYVA